MHFNEDQIDEQISQNQFIQKLKKELPQKLYRQLLREIQEEKFTKFATVFRYGQDYLSRFLIIGDPARKFYIVLEGAVLILLPFKTLKTELTLNQAVESFLSINFASCQPVRILEPGSAFGEIALLHDQNRTASVVTLENTTLLSLKKDSYKRIVEGYHKCQAIQKIEFLKQNYLFSAWDNSSLNILLYDMPEIQLKRGQYVYKQGDRADDFFIVKSGEIQITKFEIQQNEDLEENLWEQAALKLNSRQLSRIQHQNQKNLQIAIVGSIECFGEEDALTNQAKRNSNAICYSQDAVIMKIRKQKYLVNQPFNNNFNQILESEQLKSQRRLAQMKLALALTQVKREEPSQKMITEPKTTREQVISSYEPSSRNPSPPKTSRSIKSVLRDRVLVQSFVNYKRKKISNNGITQEKFFGQLMEEQQNQLNKKSHIKSEIFKVKRSSSNCPRLQHQDILEHYRIAYDIDQARQQKINTLLKIRPKIASEHFPCETLFSQIIQKQLFSPTQSVEKVQLTQRKFSLTKKLVSRKKGTRQ